MGDAAGKLAHGLELLRLAQPLLELVALGEVDDVADDHGSTAELGRCAEDQDRDHRPVPAQALELVLEGLDLPIDPPPDVLLDEHPEVGVDHDGRVGADQLVGGVSEDAGEGRVHVAERAVVDDVDARHRVLGHDPEPLFALAQRRLAAAQPSLGRPDRVVGRPAVRDIEREHEQALVHGLQAELEPAGRAIGQGDRELEVIRLSRLHGAVEPDEHLAVAEPRDQLVDRVTLDLRPRQPQEPGRGLVQVSVRPVATEDPHALEHPVERPPVARLVLDQLGLARHPVGHVLDVPDHPGGLPFRAVLEVADRMEPADRAVRPDDAKVPLGHGAAREGGEGGRHHALPIVRVDDRRKRLGNPGPVHGRRIDGGRIDAQDREELIRSRVPAEGEVQPPAPETCDGLDAGEQHRGTVGGLLGVAIRSALVHQG